MCQQIYVQTVPNRVKFLIVQGLRIPLQEIHELGIQVKKFIATIITDIHDPNEIREVYNHNR